MYCAPMKSRTCFSQIFLAQIPLALALCASLAAPAAAMAQVPAQQPAFNFAGAQEPVPATGLGNSVNVAFDPLGNLFLADTANNRVVEIAAVTNAQTVLPIAGLSGPSAVAVDGSGNVFVLDTNKTRIVEYSATGVQSTLNTTGVTGMGAITTSGSSVYVVTDSGGNELYILSPGSAPASQPVSGLTRPNGVAVDSSGNVYIADSGNGRIVELPAGGRQTTFLSGLNQPAGVGVDSAGEVLYAETAGMDIAVVPAGGGPPTYLAGRYYETPANLAVTSMGDVVYFDAQTKAVTAIYRSAVPVNAAHVCAGGQGAAPCSQQVVLSYTVNYDTTLGNSVVLTEGTTGQDFTLAATTCQGNLNGQVPCTVTVNFKPNAVGLRRGAVNLLDPTNGSVLSSTFLFGQGTGAAVGFAPGIQTTISSYAASGNINISDEAVDAQGNVFTVDTALGQLEVFTPGNGGYSHSVIANVSGGEAVALDGAGNIFVAADPGLLMFTRTPSGSYTQSTLVSGSVSVVATDSRGAVYYPIQPYVGALYPTGNGGYQMAELAAQAPSGTIYGLAVDQAGAIYVAGGGQVDKFTPAASGGNPPPPLGAGNYTQTRVVTGPGNWVQVGADGSVYATDSTSIEKISPASAGGATTRLGSFGFISKFALAPNGNLIAFDNNNLQQVNVVTPPTFTFADTRVGTTSKDSPQDVVVESIGNVGLLSGSSGGLSFPAGFVQSGGTGTPPDCSSNFLLAPGAVCELNIAFMPTQQATQSGSVTLTDNALNINNATQMIAVSGTGTGNTPELVFPNPGNQIYNASFQLNASSNAPAPITFSLISGPATVSSSGAVRITGAGQVVVQAAQAASDGYTAQTVTDSFMALQGTSKVSVTVSPVTTAKSGVSLKVVVNFSDNSSGSPSGSIVLTQNGQQVQQFNLSGGTFTTGPLSKGAYTFSATYAGDANFTAASASTTYQLVPMANAFLGSATGALFQYNLVLNEPDAPTGGFTANAGGKQSSPLSIGADQNGTIWLANNNNNTLGAITFLGTPVSGQPFSGGGLNAPVGLAVDGLGQIWIANAASVSAFSNAGVPISPISGYTDPSITGTTGLLVDISGSVWISNSNSVTQILGVAAPISPPGTANANKTIGVRP